MEESNAGGGRTPPGGWGLWVVGLLLIAGAVVGASSRSGAVTPPTMPVATASFSGEPTLGTRGGERLDGTDQTDILFSFGGADAVNGGNGRDLIDPGNGRDIVHAGDGSDRIRAFDSERDVVNCGEGDDTVFADPFDVTSGCEEVYENDDASWPPTPDPPGRQPVGPRGAAAPLQTGSFVLKDEAWVCEGPVDVDLVKVVMHRRTDPLDAVSIAQNCTGRIGRVEVDTWSGDGIKVQNSGAVAHDLTIESGYVRCFDVTGAYHQDGIHVMGGSRITFKKVQVDCGRPGVNSNLFIAQGGLRASIPTDITFENGWLGSDASHTILLADTIRPVVRETVLCPGRNATVRILSRVRAPAVVRNSSPRLASATCKGA